MSPLVRRALHARLAAAATDEDVRARHLALCTDDPDADVAALLEDAATRAREREAFNLAADFAGHSVRLTPPEDGPAALRRSLVGGRRPRDCRRAQTRADPGRRARRTAAAGARTVRGAAHAGLHRGRRRHVQAWPCCGGRSTTRAMTSGSAAACSTTSAGRSPCSRGDLPAGLECKREAVEIADHTGDARMRMSSLGFLAYLEALAGTPRPRSHGPRRGARGPRRQADPVDEPAHAARRDPVLVGRPRGGEDAVRGGPRGRPACGHRGAPPVQHVRPGPGGVRRRQPRHRRGARAGGAGGRPRRRGPVG